MTVGELIARFPEIPPDLRQEPVLARFAEAFGDLLRVARNPSACASQHETAHHYYLKLIGPLSIYGYGLSTRERVLHDLEELLDRHAANPDGFASSLLPGANTTPAAGGSGR